VNIIALLGIVLAVIVNMGYNVLYFEYTLPNGAVGQILDIFDYVSNNVLMPFLAICTCILIGWVTGPDLLIGEMRLNGYNFWRKPIYVVMLKYIVPVMLFILLLGAFNVY
jgi:NSS family neurotransmitter:Na+ symporter